MHLAEVNGYTSSAIPSTLDLAGHVFFVGGSGQETDQRRVVPRGHGPEPRL